MTSPELDLLYAPAEVRDQFLNALDAKDGVLSRHLARNLTHCINPLPGMTREELGLPTGSTYGTAARHVLQLDAADPHASTLRSEGGV
jgi:hypothetical protein